MNKMGKLWEAEVCSAIRGDSSICASLLFTKYQTAISHPYTSIRGIMSAAVNTTTTPCEDNLSRHRHNGMITHSYDEGVLSYETNKEGLNIYGALRVFFILGHVPKPRIVLQIWDAEQEGSESERKCKMD